MRVATAATTLGALGSVYATQPWDMAFTVSAAIGGSILVLLLCIRLSARFGY